MFTSSLNTLYRTRSKEETNVMIFEFLPNEILLTLFEYFNGTDLLQIFYGLNSRFNLLLYKKFQLYCFNFKSISKRTFDLTCQQHLPFIANKVISHTFSDYSDTPEQMNLFFLTYHHSIDSLNCNRLLYLTFTHIIQQYNFSMNFIIFIISFIYISIFIRFQTLLLIFNQLLTKSGVYQNSLIAILMLPPHNNRLFVYQHLSPHPLNIYIYQKVNFNGIKSIDYFTTRLNLNIFPCLMNHLLTTIIYQCYLQV